MRMRNLDPRSAPYSPDDDSVSGEVDPCCEGAGSAQHRYSSWHDREMEAEERRIERGEEDDRGRRIE
jgi:hypothetical protein